MGHGGVGAPRSPASSDRHPRIRPPAATAIAATPTFELINPGTPGAALLARLPPTTSIHASAQGILAHSPSITRSRTLHGAGVGGVVAGLARAASGGDALLTTFTAAPHGSEEQAMGAEGGSVLLAPREVADLAHIELDGTVGYLLRARAFLACTPQLSCHLVPTTLGLRNGGAFQYHVQGRGTLAITGCGSLMRLVLGTRESYHVDPRHLVAWSSAVRVQVPVEGGQGEEAPTVSGSLADRARALWQRATRRATAFLRMQPTLYTLQGPGEVYLESRRPATLAWARTGVSGALSTRGSSGQSSSLTRSATTAAEEGAVIPKPQ